MAIAPHFSHKQVRRLVVSFATLFNGYQIKKPDGTLIEVPIKWASKQKWYTQLAENADKDEKVAITLPRMGFTISNIVYDFSRKISSLNKITAVDPDDPNKLRRTFASVPYNITFELYIATKTVDESLQLIEQIVPYFTPSFNITITEVDEIGIERDIPIKLQGVQPDFQGEGTFDGEDVTIWTLTFDAEVNFYKDVGEGSVIKHIVVDIHPTMDADSVHTVSRYNADVDPETAYINDEFSILEAIGYVDSDIPKVT